MKSALIRKPAKSILSVFSTYRHGNKATLPFKLKFESSSICNLKCKMCPLNTGLNRKQGFLKFENFKLVFDQINPVYLNLTGIGEPFMNPDIFRIIEYAKSKKTMVKFDTNANLLNQENIEKILKTNIDIVSISIDGTDKKSYEKIRIGGNFELMKNNVKEFVRRRNELKSNTKIHMFFVLQNNNINNLPRFIELADELGVDYVAGSFVVTLGKNENQKNKLLGSMEDVERLINETQELIKNTRAEVSIGPLIEYLRFNGDKEFYNKNKPCYMPWYSVFITWDGWVNPCDFSCDNEVVFGNAFTQPFKEIWNNQKVKEFRKGLLKNREGIPICKGCGVDETYLENEFKKISLIPLIKLSQKNEVS
ncbi:MAG: radical SAM protein [Candidatus Nanoarchaeia archaeon]|nr:radical SAM protein [Candidatus Nanoarchaeia archaeon]